MPGNLRFLCGTLVVRTHHLEQLPVVGGSLSKRDARIRRR